MPESSFKLVILTIVIPHQTLQVSMFMGFRYFDVLGIFRFFKGGGIEFFGHNIKEWGPGVASFFEKFKTSTNKNSYNKPKKYQ